MRSFPLPPFENRRYERPRSTSGNLPLPFLDLYELGRKVEKDLELNKVDSQSQIDFQEERSRIKPTFFFFQEVEK
jgi:hypothetical protein